jgi:hypothetical protein
VSNWLWTELHDLFDTDDGSLPRVILNYQDRQAVIRAFAYVRAHGHDATYRGASLCLRSGPEARPLDSVQNAAELVLSGEAEPFHFLQRGIVIDGTTLPDLGVSVFDGGVDFDYRMGADWKSPQVVAFFRLLQTLATFDPTDPQPVPALEDHVLPEVAAKFRHCWERFVANHAA